MVYVSIVLLSQFEWNSRDSPTETRLTDGYRSLSFVTPANFPRTLTVRRMANDVTYTMYAGVTNPLRVQSMMYFSVVHTFTRLLDNIVEHFVC